MSTRLGGLFVASAQGGYNSAKMKPPHSRRPGAAPGGSGPSSKGPSGKSPHRTPSFRSGGAERDQRDTRPPRRDDRSEAPERPRGERTLSIRPKADAPRGPRPQGDAPRGDGPRAPRPQSHAPRQPGEAQRNPRAPQSSGGERPRFTAAPRRNTSPVPTDPDAPRGALWLYGTHAVAAALANPARRLRRLLATEDAEAAVAAKLPKPWPVGIERTDRARLDTLLGRDVVHQGVALLVDPLAPPALGAVLERPGPILVLDQVGDPRNIGAILRAAASFRVAAVIVQDRNSPEETGALAKAASGALETMPLLRAVNIARTLIALKAAGCWVIGLDAGGSNLSGPALAERRVALVLGNEGEGLRRLTRDTCDEIAGIAMPGSGNGLDSLNVSAATAVALYELGRSR